MAEGVYEINDKLSIPVEEAYKVLRANVQFCGFDHPIKTLSITSCNPSEGKTTTSINLAISMAKAGKKVLLIDGDLRKPMVLKRLGGKNTKGLSNLISGTASFEEVLNHTSIPNFDYIACGPKPPNPSELISSARFSEFLKTVREAYDMVIVDTPPLGSVIDCAVISSQTDGTLMVIKANSVDYRQAQRVKQQLEKANAKILGVVLNKVDKKDYKTYYRYNYHYGSDDKKKKRT